MRTQGEMPVPRDRRWYAQLREWLKEKAPCEADSRSNLFLKEYLDFLQLFWAFEKSGDVGTSCSLTPSQYRDFLKEHPVFGRPPTLSGFGKLCSFLATGVLQPACFLMCSGEGYRVGIAQDKKSGKVTFTSRNRSRSFGEALDSSGDRPRDADTTKDWLLNMFWAICPRYDRRDSEMKKSVLTAFPQSRPLVRRGRVDLDRPILAARDPEPHKAIGRALLEFIWEYPTREQPQESWGVKESRVLLGDLRGARKHPGLGVSIFSTQLAQEYFGKHATGRIDECIEWAKSRTAPKYQHQLLARNYNDVRGRYEKEPDFRHTLAFAVILARAGKEPNYVRQYHYLALSKQMPNGGWPAEAGETKSELFSAMYAVEFLDLCTQLPTLTIEKREASARARDDGVGWLARQLERRPLWRAKVFKKLSFDRVFGTAWTVRRLAPFARRINEQWVAVLAGAVEQLVMRLDNNEWREKLAESPRRVFRIEARGASAAAVATRVLSLGEIARRNIMTYLERWRSRAHGTLRSLRLRDMDLSTALFLADSLLEPDELDECARAIGGKQ